ncbi:MAG: dihydrofolate reductase-like domain-containing protein [Piptocephalis tieghemiana]|nr:MAG: dihydrofolate reductase-like domain-containing protein [Piptocephalis tieghemiana]
MSFLQPYLTRPAPQTRPYVTLTYAQSLDGKIAGRGNQQLRLSGPSSMILTHYLRSTHEGILVGIGTVLADDPRLTARLPPGEGGEKGGDLNPQPIVLDPSLRTPPTCRLLNAQAFARGEQRKPWIVCGPRPDPERRKALEQAGATILPVVMEEGQGGGEGESRCLSIPAILTCLMDQGLKSIMVEGGAKVIRSFLQASDQVDALIVTIAPTLVGDQGVSAVASRSGQEKRNEPSSLGKGGFEEVKYSVFGQDVVMAAVMGKAE